MRKAILVIAAMAVLGGLFIILKPKPVNEQPGQTTSPAATNPSSESQSSVKTFELVLRDRKLVSGSATISVTQGDEVVIRVISDEDEELHLHGYDKSVELQKDTPAELRFTAELTGNFSYELEKSGTEIGFLQVQPE